MQRGALLTLVLAIGAFTSQLNVLMLSPLLTSIADDLGVAEAAVGQLATLHAIVGAVVALLVAPIMDFYSRRQVLRLECAVLIAGTAVAALAPSFDWLLFARAFAGLTGAIILATCLAAVGDLFPDPLQRNQRIGVVGSAVSLTAVIGLPILTQIAAFSSWRWAVGSVLLPTTLVLIGSWWLPSSPPRPRTDSFWRDYVSSYRRVLQHRETTWLLAQFVVVGLLIGGSLLYLGAFATTDFGMDANRLSLLFLAGGCSHIVSSNLTPIVLRRIGPPRAFVIYTSLLLVNLIAVGLVYRQPWQAFLFTVVLTQCGAALFLVTRVLLLDSLPSARGTVMSLQAAGAEIGWAAGAAVGGLALATFDAYETVYHTYALFVPLAVLCLGFSRRATRSRPAASSGSSEPQPVAEA